MGILNFVEEVAGAVIADKALEAADPNAGFLAEAAAAVAGFEGVKMVNEKVAEGEAPAPESNQT
jgi:hypothetical protein